MRSVRRFALPFVVALSAALLPLSPVHAQEGDPLPFQPLETSAECSIGGPRDIGVSIADGIEEVVTARDRASAQPGRDTVGARALGRALIDRSASSLPVGEVTDDAGNLYAAASTRAGIALYRISGKSADRVHVLQVGEDRSDGTGDAAWLPILDVDLRFLDRAALASNATTWSSVADVAVDGDRLYIALPQEHRVLAVSLDEGKDRWGRERAEVWAYVEADVNAPWAFAPPTSEDSFTFPAQLSVDGDGLLYIAEDVDGDGALKARGDDVWVAARPSDDGVPSPAVGRWASLEECDAEVTGLHADQGGTVYLRVRRKGYFFGLALKN